MVTSTARTTFMQMLSVGILMNIAPLCANLPEILDENVKRFKFKYTQKYIEVL